MEPPQNIQDFQDSLRLREVPLHWPEGLKALWFDAKDDWEASHNIAQDMHTGLGSWIHAYLHRKEGDAFNAGYWYRKAGKPYPTVDLKTEHLQLVAFVLTSD
ncbi:hypothetical protein [Maribacter sp. 2-571]|uniref:hypothetical protein n=1 Tax=Maribacter sp. 2-571 TaxID=3417569 RepID=UPI003D32D9CC